MCNEGVVIGPSWIVFRLFVPTRQFRYDDLAEAQAIGTRFGFKGIRFTSRSTGKWAIFWTWSREQIFPILSNLTESVNDDPVKLNYINPGPI